MSLQHLTTILTLLAPLINAAPKGGKGGGGGRSGGGSSSSSCTYLDPCESDIYFMYGDRSSTFFSNASLYGQVILYAIWTLSLLISYFYLKKTKAAYLRLAIISFALSLTFLVVRYALILASASLPLGYRHESSISILFWRLGFPFLFLSLAIELELGTLLKSITYIGIAIYAVLNVAYIIMDFLLSAHGITYFKENQEWYVSDRDFGLTLDADMVARLPYQRGTSGPGIRPGYIRERFFNLDTEKFQQDRGAEIKVGLAADYIAFGLAVLLVGISLWRIVRKKTILRRFTTIILLVTSLFLVLTTLFRIIVCTHYVLHNWAVVNSFSAWTDFFLSYPSLDISKGYTPPGGFLEGYRSTVTGFFIAQAIIEPLGVVGAVVGLVYVVVGKAGGSVEVKV